MQKKTQKWTIVIIIVIISVTMIGSGFMAIFPSSSEQTAEDQRQQIMQKEYNDRKQIVEVLNTKLKESPEEIETLLALGDAYYEKSRVTVQMNINEYKEDLQKAIEMYQKVLAQKEDNSVMLKLAASAFLLGDSEVAEQTYLNLLQKEPENIDALYGYGMFLFYEKEDAKQAEEKWQKALDMVTDDQLKKRLEEMIALAKGINTSTNEQKAND